MENLADSHLDQLLPDSKNREPKTRAEIPHRRSKSSLRLKYEAETQVIERKLGSLESIRGQLGLSQRKMAQLLLVDPSAWTRWTKGEDQAPPHIFRMLQWYLALEEKYPALDVNFWLNTVAQVNENLVISHETAREFQLAKIRFEELETRRAQDVDDTHSRLQTLEHVQTELRRQDVEICQAFDRRERGLRRQILWLASATLILGALIGFATAWALK